MNDFAKSSRVLSTSPEGSVIEFTFREEHHQGHGPKMKEYIDSVLEKETASGVVINVLDYSYEFGNDLFCVFMVGFEKRVCIVARGQTQASLVSLLEASHAETACDVTFAATTAEVAQWLNARVRRGRREDHRPPGAPRHSRGYASNRVAGRFKMKLPPNTRMHRTRSRASLGRSPVMRSPLGRCK